MNSLFSIKKCFDVVNGLKNKIFGALIGEQLKTCSEKEQQKPNQKSIKNDCKIIQPTLLEEKLKQSPLISKGQKSRHICFDTFNRISSDPLKNSPYQPALTVQKAYPRSISQQNKINKNLLPLIRDQPSKKQEIKKMEVNKIDFLKNKAINQISPNKICLKVNQLQGKTKILSTNLQSPNNVLSFKQSQKTHKDSPKKSAVEKDNQQQIDDYKLSKKDKIYFKKLSKMPIDEDSIFQKPQIILFTYDDGDDISSISDKSETTDQIQPQILRFINKKNMVATSEIQKIRKTQLIEPNMKKKNGPQEGKTVKVKCGKNKQREIFSFQMSEQVLQESQNKKKWNLLPGQTAQQLKKRIIKAYRKEQSSSSQSQSSQFPKKVIKTQNYEKVLNSLSSSWTVRWIQQEKQLKQKQQQDCKLDQFRAEDGERQICQQQQQNNPFIERMIDQYEEKEINDCQKYKYKSYGQNNWLQTHYKFLTNDEKFNNQNFDYNNVPTYRFDRFTKY